MDGKVQGLFPGQRTEAAHELPERASGIGRLRTGDKWESRSLNTRRHVGEGQKDDVMTACLERTGQGCHGIEMARDRQAQETNAHHDPPHMPLSCLYAPRA